MTFRDLQSDNIYNLFIYSLQVPEENNLILLTIEPLPLGFHIWFFIGWPEKNTSSSCRFAFLFLKMLLLQQKVSFVRVVEPHYWLASILIRVTWTHSLIWDRASIQCIFTTLISNTTRTCPLASAMIWCVKRHNIIFETK